MVDIAPDPGRDAPENVVRFSPWFLMHNFIVPCLAVMVSLTAHASAGPLLERQALEAAVESGEHERAVEISERLLAAQPDDASLWYALGRSAFILKDHELAVRASTRAWEMGYRSMPWIALRIARSSAALERDEEALIWLERAIDRGLENRASLLQYEELARLAGNPRFQALSGVATAEGRVAGVAADLSLLVAEARRLHPEYWRRAEAFELAAADIGARAADLSDRELLFQMMRLVALLGDGHSAIYGPGEGSPLEVPQGGLPVVFFLFEEGLFIVDGAGAGADLIGRRVLRIGDRTPEELVAAVEALRGAENAMTIKWLGVHFYFPQIGFLIETGAVDAAGPVPLTLAVEGGGTETVTLDPGSHQFHRKLQFQGPDGKPPPLYLSRVDTSFWFERLPGDAVLYFQFNQVRDTEDESIAAFAGRLGEALREPETRHLIVDVRHNNGGNNGLLRPLVREIVAFDTRPDSQVWVITGRGTFSAAQNFVNRIERWVDALFVGEPSSSSPNFVGEETELVLPWSRLRGSISSRFWQDSDPGDDRRWIAPQLPVPPKAADYFAGKDAALEAILEAIGAE